jgi:hypothetical protein
VNRAPDDAVVVLLRRHVQRREAILRLNVDAALVLDQDGNDLLLEKEKRDKKRVKLRVSVARQEAQDKFISLRQVSISDNFCGPKMRLHHR